ncbi:MAG TPA: zinc-binding dehydrogenase [Capsulimonadaceae bacterium]|jgi:NADPH:quinone reductase-like Zn-dependent oxidoreductase
MSIRAVVVDQNVPGKLVIREVDEPAAGPSDAIVAVAATSLNLGEVRYSQGWETGTHVGWDLAGIVEVAAADGSGPSVGSRVAGFIARGAWAQKVAIPASALGVVPATVSFTQAATLPVAGLTAYHALKQRGDLLGRKVLITGASGGVGHFAVQLAKAAGAFTVALLRSESKRGLVAAAKPDAIVVSADAKAAAQFGPYDLVVEAVGGETFAAALTMLAKDGVLVTFGATSSSEVTFPLGSFFGNGGNKIYGLTLFHEVVAEPAGIGLGVLGRLVADGRVVPHVDIETSWDNVADIAQQMLAGKIQGKAVMTIGG